MGKGHTQDQEDGKRQHPQEAAPQCILNPGLTQPLHTIQSNCRPQPCSRGCDSRYRHPEKDRSLPDLNRDKPDFRETAMDCHTSPLGLQGNHGTAESQGPAPNSKKTRGDFPGGPGVQSLSSNAGVSSNYRARVL